MSRSARRRASRPLSMFSSASLLLSRRTLSYSSLHAAQAARRAMLVDSAGRCTDAKATNGRVLGLSSALRLRYCGAPKHSPSRTLHTVQACRCGNEKQLASSCRHGRWVRSLGIGFPCAVHRNRTPQLELPHSSESLQSASIVLTRNVASGAALSTWTQCVCELRAWKVVQHPARPPRPPRRVYKHPRCDKAQDGPRAPHIQHRSRRTHRRLRMTAYTSSALASLRCRSASSARRPTSETLVL